MGGEFDLSYHSKEMCQRDDFEHDEIQLNRKPFDLVEFWGVLEKFYLLLRSIVADVQATN